MSLKKIWEQEKNSLIAVFLLAFAVRFLYLFSIMHLPTFRSPMLDGAIHDQWALDILGGNFWGNAAFFRAPLYPYFLALVYRIFGHSYFMAGFVQLVLGSLSCCLIYLLARRVFENRIVALIAGLMAAFYWMFIYSDIELLLEALFIFLMLLGFVLLLEAVENKGRPWFFWSGLVFGLSAITRPNILAFMPLVLLWIFLVLKHVLEQRKTLALGLVFTLGVCLPVFSVTLHNLIVGGDLVLVASQGGVNFYIGNNPLSNGTTAIVPGTRGDWWGGYFDTINIAERAAGRPLKPSEVSRFWYHKGLAFIFSRPGQALRLTAHKFRLFWDNTEHSNNKNVYFFRAQSAVLRWPIFFSFAFIAPLALAGFILAKKDRYWWLFTSFSVIYMASVVEFFVADRFRLPLIPVLIIYAAFTIYQLYERWIARDLRRLGIALGLIVIFAVILQLNATGRPDLSKINDGYFIMANAYHNLGEYDKALELYKKTTALKAPYRSRSYKNLGLIYLRNGNYGYALQALHTAVQEEPALLPEIASELLGEERGDALAALLDRLDKLDPILLAQAYGSLGDHYVMRHDFDRAADYYEISLREYPAQPAVLINLANIYSLDKKGFSRAERSYRAALRLDPNNVSALNDLAQLYRSYPTVPTRRRLRNRGN